MTVPPGVPAGAEQLLASGVLTPEDLQQFMALQGGMAGAGQSTSPYPSLQASDRVYMGDHAKPLNFQVPRMGWAATTPELPWTGGKVSVPGGSTYLSGSEAMNYLQRAFDENDPMYDYTKGLMVKAGAVQADASVPQVMAVWADYAQLSARAVADGRDMTPWDYLEAVAAQADASFVPTTTTETSTSVHRSSGADLKAIVENASQQTLGGLGRRARAGELKGGIAATRAAEAANPTTTRTTRTQTSPTTARTRSNTTGGIGVAGLSEIAQEKLMTSKDYGAYQAAGIYFPALMAALGATANVQ